ncbi:MAG: response regulator [Bacteroidota bacterium]
MENKIKVFIVDDEQSWIESLVNFFQYSDYVEFVGEARSGKECLEKIDQQEVDTILMDIMMETPRAGFSAAEKIIANSDSPPKIIFFTSKLDRKNIIRALDMQCSFVDKSCQIRQIIQVIRDVNFSNEQIIKLNLN